MLKVGDVVLFCVMFVLALAIAIWAGVRDSHMREAKIDCRILIGSWHPDVPREAIEACRKRSVK